MHARMHPYTCIQAMHAWYVRRGGPSYIHHITSPYITLHYTTPHYTTLHYTTLHYITFIEYTDNHWKHKACKFPNPKPKALRVLGNIRTYSRYLRKPLPINVQDIQNPSGFAFYQESSLCDIPAPALDWAGALQKTQCPRAVALVSPPDKLHDVMMVQVGQNMKRLFCQDRIYFNSGNRFKRFLKIGGWGF